MKRRKQNPERIEELISSYVSQWKCPACKTEIRETLTQGPHIQTEQRFCKNCGVQVWGKCSCGANIRYDMATCSECGVKNLIYLGDKNTIYY